MSDSKPAADLRCVVVTPEQTVIDTAASFVATPLHDGEIGVARNHSPMIGRLGFGELRVTTPGGVETMYVDGGFVQVADGVVSILTGRALKVDAIELAAAQEQLNQALAAPTPSGAGVALRQRAIDQARGQLRVARRARIATNGES